MITQKHLDLLEELIEECMVSARNAESEAIRYKNRSYHRSAKVCEDEVAEWKEKTQLLTDILACSNFSFVKDNPTDL